MKYFTIVLCLLCGSNVIHAGDEVEIRKLFKVRSTAWNNKDVNALTAPFAKDIDYITSSGKHYRSKKQIGQIYGQLLSSDVYKQSESSQNILSVQVIRPEIAIVDSEWTLSGIHPPDSSQSISRSGKSVIVLHKEQSGIWKIIAMRTHVLSAE
ncbi:MAG: hypothetical protein CME32_01225 [Gimesia sp.]|nr:hypothetical protein [Gimesia sp.]